MTQQLVPVSRSQPELARNIVLVADDYAMSAGISLGIESLARNGRISAASAIVTLPRWREDAPRLATLRDRIAIGLHINLTLGAPLTRMATIAPDGKFPEIAKLMRLPLLSRHDRAHAETEMALEIARQLAEFEDATGFAPDFLDGHQHVHALPVVRRAFFSALSRHYAEFGRRPLIRIPSGNPSTTD